METRVFLDEDAAYDFSYDYENSSVTHVGVVFVVTFDPTTKPEPKPEPDSETGGDA